LEPLCRKVLEHFQLPNLSLICIFDDEERPEFTASDKYGENLCGIFFEYVRDFRQACPDDLDEYVWKEERFLCDVVIYLRYRTCLSLTGMTITFAHELQHFMQLGFNYKAFRANCLLLHYLRCWKKDQRPLWKFPHEYEAPLVSKRVSELVLTRDMVSSYTEQKIEEKNDLEKWRFFQGLDAAESFDLLERTKPLVNQYREELKENFRTTNTKEPDFTKENWWE
jgi:hypothetical protein